MSILGDLQSVQQINASTLPTIVSISNDNFTKISQALYAFLVNISYNEEDNSIALDTVETNVLRINRRIELIINSDEMFSVDENGRVRSKSFVADDIAEAKRFRLKLFNGFPAVGHPGEIVYGKQTLTSPLDFWGYIQGIGWLSLTGSGGGGNGWMGAVIDIVSSQPVPSGYGRYLIDWRVPATGLFVGNEGNIAMYDFDAAEWVFFGAIPGMAVANESNNNLIYVAQATVPITWSFKESKISILSTKNKNMSLAGPAIVTNYTPTGLILLDEPIKKSHIFVTINGVQTSIGDGTKTEFCYFSRNGGSTAVDFDDIQIGDELCWNAIIAGFPIDYRDSIDIHYLTGVSAVFDIDAEAVLIEVGENVTIGDYVNMYDDAGTPKIRPADAYLKREAHGYVRAGAIVGDNIFMYSEGVNEFARFASPSPGPMPGQSVFLLDDGTVTTDMPVNPAGYNYVQILGKLVNASRVITELDNPFYVETFDGVSTLTMQHDLRKIVSVQLFYADGTEFTSEVVQDISNLDDVVVNFNSNVTGIAVCR